jgi:hypothetical protein
MNRLLSSFTTTAVFIVAFASAGTASADPFSLTGSCTLPSANTDKCGLSIKLNDTTTSNTAVLTSLSLKVNGKPVYYAKNDVKNSSSSFSVFSNVSYLPVTCGKTYKITAVVAEVGQAVKAAGTPLTVQCPAKIAL